MQSVLGSAFSFHTPCAPMRATQRVFSTSEPEGLDESPTPSEFEQTTAAAMPVISTAPAVALPARWFPVGGVKAPKILDGTLAGDAGFDPLGLARTKNGLYWMREAEVKHARLAMLAAAGWPLSELWHKSLAGGLGLDSILVNGDRAPSLLNGGLTNGWASAMLVAVVLISGVLENKAMNSGEIFWGNDKPDGYVPGDLGFDPLGLYAKRGNKKIMEEAEIKNGRLAMIAITAFAFSEFASKIPVVEQTPYLF